MAVELGSSIQANFLGCVSHGKCDGNVLTCSFNSKCAERLVTPNTWTEGESQKQTEFPGSGTSVISAPGSKPHSYQGYDL